MGTKKVPRRGVTWTEGSVKINVENTGDFKLMCPRDPPPFRLTPDPRAVLVTVIRIRVSKQVAGEVMGKTGCVVPPSLPIPSCQGTCPLPSSAAPALANVSHPFRQPTSGEGRPCCSEHQPVSPSCVHVTRRQQGKAAHSTYSSLGLAHLEISISAQPGKRPV